MFQYINTRQLPGYNKLIGMIFLVLGVAHLCKFGIATLIQTIHKKCINKNKPKEEDDLESTAIDLNKQNLQEKNYCYSKELYFSGIR